MKPRTIHQIHKSLYHWVRKTNIITLPNYYIRGYECDLFTVTEKDVIVEYEIKITKSDYKADFLKSTCRGGLRVFKHDLIKSGNRCHRFYFVCPDGLITKDELPLYCGLIYEAKLGGDFKVIKRAPILGTFTLDREFWKSIAKSTSYREGNIRSKYKYKR